MQSEDIDTAFLWDIYEAAKDIHDFVRGTTFKEFSLDKKNALRCRKEKRFAYEGEEELFADVMEILRRTVPPEEYDSLVAEDATSTLELRLMESERFAFAERLVKEFEARFLKGSLEDEDFRKKLCGLFYELSDDCVLLPVKEGSPSEGKQVFLSRIVQSGYPTFLSRLDRFLYLSQIQSLLFALVLIFIMIFLMSRSFYGASFPLFR